MTSELKVVGISMIRNDADIVEAFVRHNLRVLDHLFVIVHCPEDGTGEILKALLAEGLPMTLVFDDEPAFLQGERLTWLARQAHAALPCDFIFPIDADELIVPADRTTLDAALAAVPGNAAAARVHLRTFVPTADDPVDEPHPVRRLRFRLREEAKVAKVVLTRTFAADPSLVLDHGNHGLLRIGARADQLPAPALKGIALAHYPVRSASQIVNKTVVGYLAHIASGRPPAEEQRIATHWRRCFDDAVVTGSIRGMSERELLGWFHGRPDIAAREGEFVCDPVPAPDDLRYGSLVRNDPYATLARFAEHLIRKRPGNLDGARFEHGPHDAGASAATRTAGRKRG